MKSLLLLDVAEIALSKMPIGKKTTRIRVYDVYSELIYYNPTNYHKVNYQHCKAVMKMIFPIHKNKKKRTTVFKIKVDIAYQMLEKYGLKLRPLSHIKLST